MFENLSDHLAKTIRRLKGHGRLTEENIAAALREVRIALLEADVALPVVRVFIEQVSARAVGREVMTSLTPGQAVIKIVKQELIALLGEAPAPLSINTTPPAVVMVAGLQGAGKTTTVAKLAKYLTDKEKKKTLVASCDVYRPAAIKQLQVLADMIGVDCYPSGADQKPVAIAVSARDYARRRAFDVVLIDTAGRLHIDEEMMSEIKALHAALLPAEVLFVVDSMIGQDAVNAARVFGEALPLTGVILTKTDGDARGGAALSVRHITGQPIKFVGTGEKASELAVFHPERMASRILGMGDVLSFIEEVAEKTDREKAAVLQKKIIKGQGFTFEDFRDQLRQMQQMGGFAGILDKLPLTGVSPTMVQADVENKTLLKFESMINSMTPRERRLPAIINGARKRRIAAGSGTEIQDVNRLIKQFKQMQRMMKKLSGKGGAKKIMRQLGQNHPPGMPF